MNRDESRWVWLMSWQTMGSCPINIEGKWNQTWDVIYLIQLSKIWRYHPVFRSEILSDIFFPPHQKPHCSSLRLWLVGLDAGRCAETWWSKGFKPSRPGSPKWYEMRRLQCYSGCDMRFPWSHLAWRRYMFCFKNPSGPEKSRRVEEKDMHRYYVCICVYIHHHASIPISAFLREQIHTQKLIDIEELVFNECGWILNL